MACRRAKSSTGVYLLIYYPADGVEQHLCLVMSWIFGSVSQSPAFHFFEYMSLCMFDVCLFSHSPVTHSLDYRHLCILSVQSPVN